MSTPYLVADNADVTVLYPLASSAYGAYSLEVPEGIDIEDIHQFSAPGNELGFVASLSGGTRVGGFARRFVRADVAVTAANPNDPAWVEESNVDATLQEVSSRVSSDFFLGSTISKAGLGEWVPFDDFTIGDIARVDILGSLIDLPVTRIEPVVTEHSKIDWIVQVGGQIISDEDARLAENATIHKMLIEDRRDLAGLGSQVTQAVKEAGEAKSTASEAKSEAKDAKDESSEAKKIATTANSAAGKAQRSADGKSTVFYGVTTPTGAKAGDAWFKDLAGGGTVLMQYVNGKWVEKVNAKAIDDKLAASGERVQEAKDAVEKLETETLPALKTELENLDTEVARDVAAKLSTLETKLSNANKVLKQDLQADLTALDEALSGDLVTKLAGLKGELEAADAAGAQAVATSLAQLENRLKSADQALKADLENQLGELEADLAALDTAVGENLAGKIAALRTELKQADTAVTTTLRGELATLKTQLQNADAAVKTDLVAQLAATRKTLEDANKATNTDLSKRLEDTRKALKEASDTIAKDVAGVGLEVSKQRPGNLFPDPFFKDPSWDAYSSHFVVNDTLTLNASGVQTGIYYRPANLGESAIQVEPGASYLFTADVRFGGTVGVTYFTVYGRFPKPDGDGVDVLRLGQVDRVTGAGGNSYNWGTSSTILKMPETVGVGTGTIGFFVQSSHPDGAVAITNVRMVRAADDSLIIDGAVTAAKVKAGVIDADHIAAGAIVATKLAANSVVAGKIATSAVVADSIAANAVTTNKIAANAVTANEIAAGTITAKEIKSGTITAGEIASGAITTVKLAANSVVAGKIAAAAVTTQTIAANAVTANEIKAGTITANEIAAGTITAGEIKAGAITATEIASNAITTAKIAANAVTANEIAAGTVTADNIKAGAVTTDKIATNSVTSNEIAAGTITAGNIASNAITAVKIGANQVTTAKIATGAVTANELQAENATIDKLWTNGIAAKAITTNRILVAGNGNMLPEISSYHGSGYPNPDPYEEFGKNSKHPSMWLKGRINAYIRQPINIVAGQKYRLRYRAMASVNGTSHYMFIRQGNPDAPTYPSAAITTKVNGNSAETTYLVANGKVGTSWESFDVTFEPSTTEVAYLYIYANHTNGTDNDNGYQWFRDVRLEKMTGTTLIEDGAVTTGKVAANAITANEIAADAVTARQIKAGEITGNHIEAGSITSREMTIENGFIKNAMIENGAVDNAKIANLDAGKITTGTINANRIGANTITGSHLAVDTIEANQIKANVFTQVANSVLPLIPGTVTPTWTDGLTYVARSGTKDAELPDGIPGYYRHPSGTIAAGASKTVYNTYANVVSIDPNLEYEATWWVRSSAGSPRYMYVTLEDQNGNTDIVQKIEGTDDDGNAHSQHTWGNPIRVIMGPTPGKWTRRI